MTVFQYETAVGEHRLVLSSLTASEGLALVDAAAAIRITCFGATGYQRFGWATEKDLPALPSVGDLRALLQNAPIGLMELEAEIDGVGRFISRDDRQCVFQFANRAILFRIVKQAAPAHAGALVHALLAHPGRAFVCGESITEYRARG